MSEPKPKTPASVSNASSHQTAEPTGLVFNVQNYSVHDGPGIRVEFFMKGCPLHCEWCSNPEGISSKPEPAAYPDKCMGAEECSNCLKACPQAALLLTSDGQMAGIDRKVCVGCLACAKACLTGALTAWGKNYTVEQAMDLIRRDRVFFEKTGGGVTISGGEALLQPEFVQAVFKQCQAEGINTCLESALYVSQDRLGDFLSITDLFITDIKTTDSAKHRLRCGVDNQLILDNIRYLVAHGANLVIRTPILKGFNATDADITAIGRFILDELDNQVLQYQLLPYRQLGTEKYASLDQDYPMADFEGYDRDEWEPDIIRFLDILQSMGVNAVSGNNKKLELPK
ncbi:pyruvate formate lyase-activating protein [Actinomycetota bacterium]|nr:pyruvate formate lyase-activating protein [Actinomycetota bacterium]